MSARQRAFMAGLAALSLWSLAFLFGVVTERMRAGCDRGEPTALARDMEDR
jgi:hypothetical protein